MEIIGQRLTKPTALYVKECDHCGKRYFGKTTAIDRLHSYKGSGKLWKLHLDRHKSSWTTKVCGVFNDNKRLQSYALEFSTTNKIVESDDWFNLKPETGLDGGDNGNKEGQRKGGSSAMSKMHAEGRFNHGQRNRENGLMKAVQNRQFKCSCGIQRNAGNLSKHLKLHPTHTNLGAVDNGN